MAFVCGGRKGGWFRILARSGNLEVFATGCKDPGLGIEVLEETIESGTATHELWGTTSFNGQTSPLTLINRSTVSLPGYYYTEFSSGYGRIRWVNTVSGVNTVVGNWFRGTGASYSVQRVGGNWTSTKRLTIDNKAGSFKVWEGPNIRIESQICACPWSECQSGATGLDDNGIPGFCCFNCAQVSRLLRGIRSIVQTQMR